MVDELVQDVDENQQSDSLLSKLDADKLIRAPKSSVRTDMFFWEPERSYSEEFISEELPKIKFIIDISRNEIKIKAQLRPEEFKTIILVRVDCSKYHTNPDGSSIRGPHIHYYREGYGIRWAEKADWVNPDDPVKTLDKFLDIVSAKFNGGYSSTLL